MAGKTEANLVIDLITVLRIGTRYGSCLGSIKTRSKRDLSLFSIMSKKKKMFKESFQIKNTFFVKIPHVLEIFKLSLKAISFYWETH